MGDTCISWWHCTCCELLAGLGVFSDGFWSRWLLHGGTFRDGAQMLQCHLGALFEPLALLCEQVLVLLLSMSPWDLSAGCPVGVGLT